MHSNPNSQPTLLKQLHASLNENPVHIPGILVALASGQLCSQSWSILFDLASAKSTPEHVVCILSGIKEKKLSPVGLLKFARLASYKASATQEHVDLFVKTIAGLESKELGEFPAAVLIELRSGLASIRDRMVQLKVFEARHARVHSFGNGMLVPGGCVPVAGQRAGGPGNTLRLVR